MSVLTKIELLELLEQTVERHLEEAIRDLQNMEDALLLKPSPAGGWSKAQCLEHLNSYGRYYLPKIKEGLLNSDKSTAEERIRSTWVGNYFVKMMDPKTGKRKFGAFKKHIPSSNMEPHKVVAEFIQQQEELLLILQESRATNLNSIRIPISISKWIRLKLVDVLRFIIAHNERHLLQARKVQ